jgi:DNA-binding CsgD family transcriptional regulator
MTTEAKLTGRNIDWLLRHLDDLRAQVERMLPATGATIQAAFSQASASAGSKTEAVAMQRAELSAILDVVDATRRGLPQLERRVWRLKYDGLLPHWKIAKRLKLGERTVDRKVGTIRYLVASRLSQLEQGNVASCWRHFGVILAGARLEIVAPRW